MFVCGLFNVLSWGFGVSFVWNVFDYGWFINSVLVQDV